MERVPNEIWELIINSTDDNVALRRLSCTSKDMRALMCDDIAQRYLKYALMCRKEGQIEEMFVYLKRSASLGNAEAMFRIGHIIGSVPQDKLDIVALSMSMIWIKRAAACGHLYALVHCQMYEKQLEPSVINICDSDNFYLKGLYLRYKEHYETDMYNRLWLKAEIERKLFNVTLTRYPYTYWFKKAVEEQNNEYALEGFMHKRDKTLSFESVLKFAQEGSMVAVKIILYYFEEGSGEYQYWNDKLKNYKHYKLKNLIK